MIVEEFPSPARAQVPYRSAWALSAPSLLLGALLTNTASSVFLSQNGGSL